MLTPNETKILIVLLEDYIQVLHNNGCNDFFLENTLENYELSLRIIAASDYPEDDIYLHPKHGILFQDYAILDYFIDRLKENT